MSQDWQISLGLGSAVKADIWQTSVRPKQLHFALEESLAQMRAEGGP